ncbi:unknown protein [Azorhizobium caulinodans ORS 571]|uniref:YcxB-like C-terminal domain-containing protein n=1 Tax=Azorhizobium caulinodans (strain ATCC 43989 / DSM 5975 / JCM 20966 / LMG 6465 / NBRC 14845 / NCIMB 13405 / ORS 571) TaxID=438753 RepID=A8I4E0_AZOC5|nr:YcxB family protein [Azorhizobium caulinodans]BAF87718.1 unknown protein [Azorhizobium caulinodans ORS 571]
MTETTLSQRGPISIQLTADDVARAYQLFQTQALLSARGVLSVLFLDLVTVGLTVFAIKALSGDDLPLPLAGMLAVLFPAVMIWSTRWRNGRLARRIFAQQKSLNQPFTLAWTDEALQTQAPQGDATLPWRDLVKMKQDRHMILFFESDALFRMVPRRVLSQAQQDDLLRTAETGMGGGK